MYYNVQMEIVMQSRTRGIAWYYFRQRASVITDKWNPVENREPDLHETLSKTTISGSSHFKEAHK